MHTAFLHRVRYVLCSTLACLLLASTAPSRARACRVDVFGAGEAAWRASAEQLPLDADDCAAVHVEVEGDHALVTLIRSDGRRVARAVAAPAELASAVEALKLADPDEPAPAPTVRVENAQVLVQTAPAQPVRRATSLTVGLLVGVRGGEFGLVSPVIATPLMLRIRSWELALTSDWEPAYYDGTGKAGGPLARGVAPGLGFARRQQLAHGEFLVGARVGFAFLRSTGRARMPGFFSLPASDEDAFAGFNFTPAPEYQGRAAVFFGYVQPLHRLLRLRMELSTDGVWISSRAPIRLGPAWALGTQIGIEFGAP